MNLAVKNLLDRTINTLKTNRLAQAGAGAIGAYTGANAFNAISPIDIDPEAALVAGGLAPYLALNRGGMGRNRPMERLGPAKNAPLVTPYSGQTVNVTPKYGSRNMPNYTDWDELERLIV